MLGSTVTRAGVVEGHGGVIRVGVCVLNTGVVLWGDGWGSGGVSEACLAGGGTVAGGVVGRESEGVGVV